MGYSGSVIDTTALSQNTDTQTLLTRITAAVALNSDMATLLARVTAAVALNSDMATLLARVTAAVALNSDMATVLGRLTAGRATNLDNLDALISSRPAYIDVAPQNFEGDGIALTSGGSGALGSYVQVVASTSHTVIGVLLSVRPQQKRLRTVVSAGGAGSEVVKVTFWTNTDNASGDVCAAIIPIHSSLIGKAVRVAVACANHTDATGGSVAMGVTLLEKND